MLIGRCGTTAIVVIVVVGGGGVEEAYQAFNDGTVSVW